MEKEENNPCNKVPEYDFCVQWGNRKKIRCVRVKDPEISRRVTSRFFTGKENFSVQPSTTFLPRNSSDLGMGKEDRYYSTRGSGMMGMGLDHENGKGEDENRGFVWPKLYITLSNKEKEEDFMAMKGCKPSQRPKKRAKIIQRSLLLVSPGAWLSDMCLERYEVREKKSSKKRPRGLKAMGGMDSDSE